MPQSQLPRSALPVPRHWRVPTVAMVRTKAAIALVRRSAVAMGPLTGAIEGTTPTRVMAIPDMDMAFPDMITATAAMATPIPGLTIDAIIGPIATTIMSGARIAVIIAGGTRRPAPAQGRAPAKTPVGSTGNALVLHAMRPNPLMRYRLRRDEPRLCLPRGRAAPPRLSIARYLARPCSGLAR